MWRRRMAYAGQLSEENPQYRDAIIIHMFSTLEPILQLYMHLFYNL